MEIKTNKKSPKVSEIKNNQIKKQDILVCPGHFPTIAFLPSNLILTLHLDFV